MITPLATQMDVGVGSDVSVACIVQGYPPPVVQWTRLLGAPLPPNSYNIGSNLTITSITFTSGGTYQCTATNECDRVCGTDNATIMINVHGMYSSVELLLEGFLLTVCSCNSELMCNSF